MQDSAAFPSNPSAPNLDAGGTPLAISAEQPPRAICSGRPSDYINKVSLDQMDREEAALLAWSKRTNRLISQEEISIFLSRHQKVKGGNKEHDVWKLETSSAAVVILRTKGGMDGLPFRSPTNTFPGNSDSYPAR